jgi:hypothetical protein
VPMAARAIGLSMPDLCAKLVNVALTRGVESAQPRQVAV